MKNKTELQSVAGKTRNRTGPAKEKVQITVRIDRDVMDKVYPAISEENVRITDAIEQGLLLWLHELQHELPKFNRQVRFVLANLTAEQAELVRGLAIAMVEDEIERPSEDAAAIYEFCARFLRARNKLMHGAKCLELYGRYGKSAEEIAKLG